MEKVIYSGYTPSFHNPESLPHVREKLDRQIAKAALGAEEMVAQEKIGAFVPWLERQREAGWRIMGLENNLTGEEEKRKVTLGQTKIGQEQPVVLILGEEVAGIPQEIRDVVETFVEIPMRGRKESFNVSVATGIAAWGLMNEGL